MSFCWSREDKTVRPKDRVKETTGVYCEDIEIELSERDYLHWSTSTSNAIARRIFVFLSASFPVSKRAKFCFHSASSPFTGKLEDSKL
ncbi:hypothetical protein KQX54_005257 [Cotesia glomerata]|uniref:Uncharacterized protein n=1 Tax=Cotesia glomerata TaxID=32391 RepID=A0AAV7I0D3_COTGL|nr:hypothetical protein KQX54_005257 [Cotesia glomerata]